MRRRKLFERIHLRFEIDRAYVREALSYVPRPLYSRHLLMFVGSAVLATLTVLLLIGSQQREIAFMGGIFVFAALLWDLLDPMFLKRVFHMQKVGLFSVFEKGLLTLVVKMMEISTKL